MTKHKLSRSFQRDQQIVNSLVEAIIESVPSMNNNIKRPTSPAPAVLAAGTGPSVAAPTVQPKPTLTVPGQTNPPQRPKTPECAFLWNSCLASY